MEADRARELLSKERQRIERALAEQGGGSSDELSTVDQHLGDQGSELYEDEFEAGLRERLLKELAAVERAEARVDAGRSRRASNAAARPSPAEQGTPCGRRTRSGCPLRSRRAAVVKPA